MGWGVKTPTSLFVVYLTRSLRPSLISYKIHKLHEFLIKKPTHPEELND